MPAVEVGLDEIAEGLRPGSVAQSAFVFGLQRFQRDEAPAQDARAQRPDVGGRLFGQGGQGTSLAIQFGSAKAAAWICGL